VRARACVRACVCVYVCVCVCVCICMRSNKEPFKSIGEANDKACVDATNSSRHTHTLRWGDARPTKQPEDQAHTCTHTHAHTQTHTRTRTRTRTCTHTHTHTPLDPVRPRRPLDSREQAGVIPGGVDVAEPARHLLSGCRRSAD